MDQINEILVSVIIPIYNIEKYINRCVDSVLNQSYKNLEIILIDDGSTDNCGDICDRYSQIDSRIIVIHQENQGLAASRNTGLDICIGQYISFIDGDDYIHPQTIEIMLKECLRNSSNISACGIIKDYNDLLSFERINEYKSEIINKNNIFNKYFESDNHYDLNISCNKLYYRDLFKDVRFPVGRLHEDVLTTFKLLDLCESISIVQCDLYVYFQRNDSIIHKAIDGKRIDDIIYANNMMISFFESRGIYLTRAKKKSLNSLVDIILNNSFKSNKDLSRIIKFGRSLNKSISFTFSKKEKIYYYVVFYFTRIYLKYYKLKKRFKKNKV